MGGSKEYPVCDQCRSRKIRCGRERPHCSNCTRLGLECEWLGQGKKPNQTTWLNHAVTRLDNRLERLESIVSGLKLSVDNLQFDVGSFSPQASIPSLTENICENSQRCLFSNFRGHEGYIGSKSFASLVQGMVRTIEISLCDSERESQLVVSYGCQAKEELLLLTEPFSGYRHVDDGSTVTCPPAVILDAMVDPFFEAVNPSLPLFTKTGFKNLMAVMAESPDHPNKCAYSILANNLVLLTLQAKSLSSLAVLGTPGGMHVPGTPSIDGDLIASFLLNAKRSLGSMELLLLCPSIVSLQAVLSMCLVSQSFLSEDITTLLFSMAVRVAKAIGLHQWDSSCPGEDPNSIEVQEKFNAISYILYFSRVVYWTTGSSAFVQDAIDCFRHKWPHHPNLWTMNFQAHLDLLCLEEDLISSTYSNQVSRQMTDETAQLTAAKRSRKIQDWAAEHANDLREENACSTGQACARYELAIRQSTVQILALWPLSDDSDASRSMLDACRHSIRLYKALWSLTPRGENYLSLIRLVAVYPAIAFFELTKHFLSSRQASVEDSELVLFFIEMVSTLSENSEENSSLRKFATCGKILQRLINIRLEQKSPHRGGFSFDAMSRPNFMNTLELYPSPVMTTSPKTRASRASSTTQSNSNSNSTPLSAVIPPMIPIQDNEAAFAFTSNVSSSGGSSFEGFGDGRLTLADHMDAWMLEAEGQQQPDQMLDIILEGNNGFSFNDFTP